MKVLYWPLWFHEERHIQCAMSRDSSREGTFNINGIFSLHKMIFVVETGSISMVLLRTACGNCGLGKPKRLFHGIMVKTPLKLLFLRNKTTKLLNG